MFEDAADPRLRALEERLVAVENLLLSHICASNLLVEGAAAETVMFVETQREHAEKNGQEEIAAAILRLVNEIRYVSKPGV